MLVMTMQNKYCYRSRISEAKIRQIVKLFSIDLDASQIAEISGLNRNTVNRYLAAIKERTAAYCEPISPVKGVVEVDESYFGARRVKGLRDLAASGKTFVFGLFKRNGCVYMDKVKLAALIKTIEEIDCRHCLLSHAEPLMKADSLYYLKSSKNTLAQT